MPDQPLTLASPTAKPDVNRSLFTRLKEETRQTHQDLESQLGILDVTFDLPKYRRLLERFYGFYVPWEDQVYGMAAGILPGRQKVPLLTQDLHYLGSDVNALQLCPDIPQLSSTAEAFGSMYVIEGSTLGGQLISRHLEKSFAWSNGSGYCFFGSYGPEVGRKWKSFQSTVLSHSSEEDEPAIVRAANATFVALQRWLR